MNRSNVLRTYPGDPEAVEWAQTVKRAIRSEEGQAFLRELKAALLALPKKEVIPQE